MMQLLQRAFDEICFLAGRLVVAYARVWFALFWQPYSYTYMSRWRSAMHWDGKLVHEGIRLTRQVRYSSQYAAETLDIVQPAEATSPRPSLTSPKELVPIVYVHGGAFLAASSELMLSGISFLGRAGHTVYSLDYPLAPQHRYPTALVSVLRGLAFVRQAYGVERCAIMGDSAGGNLVTMAAAMMSNPKLLRQLQESTGEPLLEMKFPVLEQLLCLYGILDTESSLQEAPWLVDIALRFIYDSYAPRGEAKTTPFCICDLADDIDHYPPTLLVAGEKDPIFRSSTRARDVLHARGVDVTYRAYPSTHAFLGFPRTWPLPRQYQQSSVDAMHAILAYLRGEPMSDTPAPIIAAPMLDRFLGMWEVALLMGLAPLPILFVSGPLFILSCFLFVAILGLVGPIGGILIFYFKHRKLPEHW
mmetsp:Transcript_131161/g.339678  ORF Transcript_131161/g.339678 Transcript_131161/m.339678 type:complete len:417 (+) Transcript_131161:25-1275(+)